MSLHPVPPSSSHVRPSQGFKRALVFLATHSDPERGDLHFATGVACRPQEVSPDAFAVQPSHIPAPQLFETLMPPSLRRYLQKQESILVLLACGATIKRKTSFDHVFELACRYERFFTCYAVVLTFCAHSGTFRATIGFAAKNFQPCRAGPFLAKFAEKYFFRRYGFDPALKASLSEEAGLGAHGNVHVISQENSGLWIERIYVWSHPASRPWGVEVSQQCPSCKRLRSWLKPKQIRRRNIVKNTTTTSELIQHKCRFCGHFKCFTKPADLIHDGVMAESGRGTWFFTVRVNKK